jgi:hypothetical protein
MSTTINTGLGSSQFVTCWGQSGLAPVPISAEIPSSAAFSVSWMPYAQAHQIMAVQKQQMVSARKMAMSMAPKPPMRTPSVPGVL